MPMSQTVLAHGQNHLEGVRQKVAGFVEQTVAEARTDEDT